MATLYRISIVSMVLVAALGATVVTAAAFDDAMYPDWKGLWERTERSTNWDPSKPAGLGQQAPLIPEYQAQLEASLKEQKAGGQGDDPTSTCLAPGLPRIMNKYEGAEFVVTP